MELSQLIQKFLDESKEATTAGKYLIQFKRILSTILTNTSELNLKDVNEGLINEFVDKLSDLYDNSVPLKTIPTWTKQYDKEGRLMKDENGCPIVIEEYKQKFKPMSLPSFGYDEDALRNALISEMKRQQPVDVKLSISPAEFVRSLSTIFWNIQKKDVPLFVESMMKQVMNTQIAAGLYKGEYYQKITYVHSILTGTGKTHSFNEWNKQVNTAGFKGGFGNYPSKSYPDIDAFADNHFTCIADTMKYSNEVNREAMEAIIRREAVMVRKPYEKAVVKSSRGGIIAAGNIMPLFDTNMYDIVETIPCNIRDDENLRQQIISILPKETPVNPLLVDFNNNLTVDFFAPLREISNNLMKFSEDSNTKPTVLRILLEKKNVELYEDILRDIFNSAINNLDLSNCSPAAIMKASDYSKNDPKYSYYLGILTKVSQALYKEDFIERTQYRQDPRYIKYNYTAWKELDFDKVAEEDQPGDELDMVRETQEMYEYIARLYENYTPTTPTDPTDGKEEAVIPETEDELFNQSFGWEDIDALSEVEDELPIEDIPHMPEEALSDTIPESNASYKDQYCTTPTNNSTDQFEVLNPLMEGETRKDENVSTRRNFIFEIDDLPLDEQKKIAKKLSEEHIINRIVYSGSKSLHMRVTVAQAIASKEEYKFIWKQLNAKYFDGHADKACANPARLTRKLGGIRQGTGKKQAGMLIDSTPLDVREELAAYQAWARNRRQQKDLIAMMDNRQPRKYATLEETVEHWRTDSEYTDNIKQAIDEVKAGVGHYDQGIAILQAAKFVGFTYEELIKEFDNFGKWNFTEQFYDSIEID